MSQAITKYTPQEELLNCLIHGLGIGLSIAGLVILAVFSAIHGDAWVVVSTVIFGVHSLSCFSKRQYQANFEKI